MLKHTHCNIIEKYIADKCLHSACSIWNTVLCFCTHIYDEIGLQKIVKHNAVAYIKEHEYEILFLYTSVQCISDSSIPVYWNIHISLYIEILI